MSLRLLAVILGLGLLAGCAPGQSLFEPEPPQAVADADLPDIVAGAARVEISDSGEVVGPDGVALPGAGAEPEATSEPEPEAAPEAEPAPPEPPDANAAIRARCTVRGGNFTRTGKGAFICVNRTRDANKRCTAAGQCEGSCLARSRTCSPVKPLIGCHEILTDGGVAATVCID